MIKPAACCFGFNTAGGAFTTATIYIDNLTLTANPVPELAVTGLGFLAISGLMFRCRR